MDHALDRNAVLAHPFHDDPRVHRRPLDGGEQLVLGRVAQVPAERYSAETRIDEYRAIAVVPRHAQKSRLSGTMTRRPRRQRQRRAVRAQRNRLEDVPDGRQPGFDADELGMHRAGYDATDTGYAVGVLRDRDHARRRPDDVHDGALGHSGADRVPMRVERADWDRDAGRKP